MKSLLIATHNPAKITEIKIGLKPLIDKGISLLTLKEKNITRQPDETGKTFEENALLKAKFYAKEANLPTIADDGGIAIKELGGQPGVKSRMWLGYETTDEKLMQHTLKQLEGKPMKDRKAYLETCLCFYDPATNDSYFKKERINGYIAVEPSVERMKGYPFRSLFLIEINGKHKYYDGLTTKEQKQLNHRLKALRQLAPKIKAHLLK
ncbi:MAG: non-canonical purine NTP pyrophosphatase [Patescibacteria group bacterium]